MYFKIATSIYYEKQENIVIYLIIYLVVYSYDIRPLEISVTESETAVFAPSMGIEKMDCIGMDYVTICNLCDHLQNSFVQDGTLYLV